MGFFSEILAIIAPPPVTLESVFQSGETRAILPAPKPKEKPAPKQKAKQEPKQADAYQIDKDLNQWGFVNDSTILTSQKTRKDAVPDVTASDIEGLQEWGLWAEETTKRGRDANNATRTAKRLWCDGATVDAIAKQTGRGVSWVEKRTAVFGREFQE